MKEGIRYIVTKGNKEGSIQKEDKICMFNSTIYEAQDSSFIVPIRKNTLKGLEYIIDLDFYKEEIQRLKNKLKETIKLYRNLLDEENNKPNKSNKS